MDEGVVFPDVVWDWLLSGALNESPYRPFMMLLGLSVLRDLTDCKCVLLNRPSQLSWLQQVSRSQWLAPNSPEDFRGLSRNR
jgi:hypothetical protein